MAFFVSKEFIIIALEVLVLMSISAAEESCETVPTEIHVTKGTFRTLLSFIYIEIQFICSILGMIILLVFIFTEEYDDMGRLVRSCSGEVRVNKCEGMCSSQVQPSISNPTGFQKVMFLCVHINTNYCVCIITYLLRRIILTS